MSNASIDQARRHEQNNEWRPAAAQWKSINCMDDYNACMLIAESIERGDRFRERVKEEAGVEPDQCTNPRAWVKWYAHMHKIYKEVYHL